MADPMTTLEARIAEVVAQALELDDDEGVFYTVAPCEHPAIIAAALAPVITEVRKDERHHVIQDIREQCEYEPPQIGDYGRVELEGYITITNPELDAIENGAGFDRMCMSVTEWETGIAEAQAEALLEAVSALNEVVEDAASYGITNGLAWQTGALAMRDQLKIRADKLVTDE